jgi:tetratricopeptide (TPR) repeat protein
LLQSSQRAWIAYRDADISALAAAGNDQKWRNLAIIDLTVMRTEQLASIVQSLSQAPPPIPPAQELPSPAVQNDSPYPEDVKALADFQNDARAVLNAFLAKKDDSFFKKADALKNAPQLQAEISNQITNLNARYSALLDRHYADKLLEPASNESAVVELLVSWSKFTQALKAGHMVDAELAIQKGFSLTPKNIAADYFPFWQAVGNWHALFVTEEPKYQEHMQKGTWFAALGKTSSAIKEYQAAYDLIPNPAIPDMMKKCREESLGL